MLPPPADFDRADDDRVAVVAGVEGTRRIVDGGPRQRDVAAAAEWSELRLGVGGRLVCGVHALSYLVRRRRGTRGVVRGTRSGRGVRRFSRGRRRITCGTRGGGSGQRALSLWKRHEGHDLAVQG